MSSSDSDEDVPLSKLKSVPKRQIVDDDNDSDSDVPLKTIKKAKRNSGSSSEDDDEPIFGLKKKVVKTEPVIKKEPKKQVKSEMKELKLEKKSISKSSSSKSVLNTEKIGFKQQECSEALYDTLKGRLVQELLCRWWYALDWPPKDIKYEETTDLQPLDGFTGSFISVKGENMGSIVDKRNSSGKPTFMTFFAMTAKEVQDLLVVAYTNQMRVLEQHEGPDAPLLQDLKAALSSAKKIDPDKAEKGGLKVLKSFTEVGKRLRDL